MDQYNNYNDDFFYHSNRSGDVQGQNYQGSQQGQSYDNSQQEQDISDVLPKSVPNDAFQSRYQESVDCDITDVDSKETSSSSNSKYQSKSYLIIERISKTIFATVMSLLYGALFLAFPFLTARYLILINTYDQCTAVITHQYTQTRKYIDGEGRERNNNNSYATCEYYYNGERYTYDFNTYNTYAENESIEIYVNPESPSEIMSKKSPSGLTFAIIRDTILIIIYLKLVADFWRDKQKNINNNQA